MLRNCLYFFVLFVAVSSWFVDISIPPKKTTVPSKVVKKATVVSDPTLLGLTPEVGATGGICNIEFVNGLLFGAETVVIKQTNSLTLRGWGMDVDNLRTAQSVVVCFKGIKNTYYLPAQVGYQRKDVVDYFSLTDDLVNSGFELNTTIQYIPKGQYHVMLVMVFDDLSLICDRGRKIQIK